LSRQHPVYQRGAALLASGSQFPETRGLNPLTNEPAPKKVILTIVLYGPFSTFQEADQHLIQWFSSPPGSVTLPLPALASIPHVTDDWTNWPQQITLSLPATLASSYYVWHAEATEEQGFSSAGASLTVQITAR